MSIDVKPRSGRPSTARIDENVVCQGRSSFIVWSSSLESQSNIYLEVLKRLRNSVPKKIKTRFVADRRPVLPPRQCTSLIAKHLAKNGMVPLPHAPYSPDLATFSYFHAWKEAWKDTDLTRKRTINELPAISKNNYKKCFEQWKRLWDKRVSCNGEYFEGDKDFFVKQIENKQLLKNNSGFFWLPTRI